MDMRNIIRLIESSEHHISVYLPSRPEDAQNILDGKFPPPPLTLYFDPNDALDTFEDDPCVVLEFYLKSSTKQTFRGDFIDLQDPADLDFRRIYTGVIDDPIVDLEGPLDEVALGGLERCTALTINSLLEHFRLRPILIGEVPETDQGVLQVLDKHGLAYRPIAMPVARTVAQFAMQHQHGAYYLVTEGHAMALIDNELFDAMNLGPDGRKLLGIFEISRR